MRRDLPRGGVKFLFTDIEGSTNLLHELGPAGYAEALAEYRRALARRSRDTAASRSTRRRALRRLPDRRRCRHGGGECLPSGGADPAHIPQEVAGNPDWFRQCPNDGARKAVP